MAKPHERVFALVAAIVFLATSVAFSIAVVWQIRSENNTNTNQAVETENPPELTQAQEGKLEGTKLKDFTPVASVAELQKIDIKVGEGEEVKVGATVKAHYTGALAKDGTIFQSSYDMGEAVEFGLDQVIKGWTDGVPGMKVGGTRRLIIPAALAYGSVERPGIPANSDLVFDITLEGVTQ